MLLAGLLLLLGACAAPPETPPVTIHIVEPLAVLPSRGGGPALPAMTLRAGTREVVLRVHADAGLRQVTVNGREAQVDAQGLLRVPMDAQLGSLDLYVTAVDQRSHRAELRFVALLAAPGRDLPMVVPSTLRESSDLPPFAGEYHALLIGNDDYTGWERLDTPGRDVQDLRNLLRNRFGFKVTVLQNASRRDIFAAFATLRATLGPTDKLLVYYAGHGELDAVTQRGYWIPVDAERRNRSNWVSMADITDHVRSISARQVLVVADSCYAGTMTRLPLPGADDGDEPAARPNAQATAPRPRVRVALTSGSVEPVVDGGGGRNSLFARTLIDVLQALPEPMPARRLHRELIARFGWRAQSLGVMQQPDYAPIRYAGHEAGDFVFVPRR